MPSLGLDFILVCKPDAPPVTYEWVEYRQRTGAVGTVTRTRWTAKRRATGTYRYTEAVPPRAARHVSDTLASAGGCAVAVQLRRPAGRADGLPALPGLRALDRARWRPNPQGALLAQRRAVAAAVGQQAAALAGLSEQIAADDSLSPEQRDALQQPLEEALATLAEPGVSQAEAVAALSQAETELRELGQTFDHAAASASVAAAADALSRSPAAGEVLSLIHISEPTRPY